MLRRRDLCCLGQPHPLPSQVSHAPFNCFIVLETDFILAGRRVQLYSCEVVDKLVWMEQDIFLRLFLAYQVRLTLLSPTGSHFILFSASGVTDWEERGSSRFISLGGREWGCPETGHHQRPHQDPQETAIMCDCFHLAFPNWHASATGGHYSLFCSVSLAFPLSLSLSRSVSYCRSVLFLSPQSAPLVAGQYSLAVGLCMCVLVGHWCWACLQASLHFSAEMTLHCVWSGCVCSKGGVAMWLWVCQKSYAVFYQQHLQCVCLQYWEHDFRAFRDCWLWVVLFTTRIYESLRSYFLYVYSNILDIS